MAFRPDGLERGVGGVDDAEEQSTTGEGERGRGGGSGGVGGGKWRCGGEGRSRVKRGGTCGKGGK